MTISQPEENDPVPPPTITPADAERPSANSPLLDMTLVVVTVVVLALTMSWWLGGNVVPEKGSSPILMGVFSTV
jgi:hypothetical protein